MKFQIVGYSYVVLEILFCYRGAETEEGALIIGEVAVDGVIKAVVVAATGVAIAEIDKTIVLVKTKMATIIETVVEKEEIVNVALEEMVPEEDVSA